MQVAGLLDTGCWILVAGYLLLDTGYSILVAGYLLLDISYWYPVS